MRSGRFSSFRLDQALAQLLGPWLSSALHPRTLCLASGIRPARQCSSFDPSYIASYKEN